ncbi:MAG TPA: cyclase family protein [Spirochaetota bacterium]|nr:cyclase family protein [Spirochaetota bacterium]HPJ34710.1 cyclase family protein [Spirochaetota bacterium]
MKIIDLSHKFDSMTPVYPGTEPPSISHEATIDNNGFSEKLLTFSTHTGTHIDVPAHIIKGGAAIDTMEISRFTGRGYAVDVSKCSYDLITIKDLIIYEEDIKKADFLILHSGWYRYCWSDSYFTGFPVLSHESAEWLTGFNLKGIGVDTISADPVESTDYSNHMTLLSNNIIIIENLKDTDELTGKEFTFYAFPLNIENGDGSPVRAVAII